MMDKEMEYYTIYLSLGDKRSLDALVEATGKSKSYLSKLSTKHNWQERLNTDAAKIVEDVKAQYVNRQVRHTETKLALSERIYKMIEDGLDNVTVEDARDVKTLLEVYSILTGKPTHITKDVTSVVVDDLSDDELSKIADILTKDEDKTVN